MTLTDTEIKLLVPGIADELVELILNANFDDSIHSEFRNIQDIEMKIDYHLMMISGLKKSLTGCYCKLYVLGIKKSAELKTTV